MISLPEEGISSMVPQFGQNGQLAQPPLILFTKRQFTGWIHSNGECGRMSTSMIVMVSLLTCGIGSTIMLGRIGLLVAIGGTGGEQRVSW